MTKKKCEVFLINLFHVEEYSRTQVTLTNKEKLPLSKYKYDDFVKAHLLERIADDFYEARYKALSMGEKR